MFEESGAFTSHFLDSPIVQSLVEHGGEGVGTSLIPVPSTIEGLPSIGQESTPVARQLLLKKRANEVNCSLNWLVVLSSS